MSVERRQKIVEAMALLETERSEALKRVVKTHEQLRQAQLDYEEALLAAHAVGVRNTHIARKIGVTETAVRTYVKRRKSGAPHRPV